MGIWIIVGFTLIAITALICITVYLRDQHEYKMDLSCRANNDFQRADGRDRAFKLAVELCCTECKSKVFEKYHHHIW